MKRGQMEMRNIAITIAILVLIGAFLIFIWRLRNAALP